MTFYLIARADDATLLTDDPVLPPDAVTRCASAVYLVAAASHMRAEVESAAARAAAAARDAGYREGEAAAAADVQRRLFALSLDLAAERNRLRGDVARLAVEVVRRVAGELGEAPLVAALAERATAGLLPDDIATVRVAPGAQAAVRHRLARLHGVTVTADGTLAPNDCVVETKLGVSHAGLDTQLAAIERAWAGLDPAAADAA